jgi:hypothetical protein
MNMDVQKSSSKPANPKNTLMLGAAFWVGTLGVVSTFEGGQDKEFKDFAAEIPSFNQMHNEAVAYDFIRVAEIGANIEIDDAHLDGKLRSMQYRLDPMLNDMKHDYPGVYDSTIEEVRQEAQAEARAGLWSQEALSAYADATTSMDIRISNAGHAAIDSITKSENVTHFEADRMAAVSFAYALADMSGAPKQNVDDNLRVIAEKHQEQFAELYTPLQTVMSVNSPEQPDNSIMVSNPFPATEIEQASLESATPEHS